MNELLESLLALVTALWSFLSAVFTLVLPWTPLLAWVAFWLLAVNWVKYAAVLAKGGWTGLVFTGFMIIMMWGLIAPPEAGVHYVLGLSLSNFVGKAVYVVSLIVISFLCGAAQMSGACGSLVCFKDDEESADQSHAAAH